MNVKPSTVLKKARALLIDKGWCQHDYARDKDGSCVPTDSRKAVAFCMLGATDRAAKNGSAYLAREYLREVLPKRWDEALARFNDAPKRKKEQVIAVFDEAIALAQERGE